MGENTGISWTHHSFNPWIGCVKVSPGCQFCYAEKLATGKMGLRVWGKDAARHLTKTTWSQIGKWHRDALQAGERRRVFVASMADVFEDRPDLEEPRRQLWDAIRATPGLDWLILTKRPENFARLLPKDWGHGFPNVWLGVSAENQHYYQRRVPLLSKTPARIRFVSYEPAIGPINIFDVEQRAIDWIIVGGESGPERRPFNKDWARKVRDDCAKVGIAFFYKQEGGPRPEGKTPPLLDGRIHHDYPLPKVTA
jgi:protein gp37